MQRRISSVVVLVIGTVLLGVAIFLGQKTSAFVATAARTEGQVIALKAIRQSSKSGRSFTYSPVVVFHTSANENIEFTSKFSTSPPMHHVGQTVAVLYQPGTPQEAQLADFWSLWFAPVLLSGMGTLLIVIALFLIRK